MSGRQVSLTTGAGRSTIYDNSTTPPTELGYIVPLFPGSDEVARYEARGLGERFGINTGPRTSEHSALTAFVDLLDTAP